MVKCRSLYCALASKCSWNFRVNSSLYPSQVVQQFAHYLVPLSRAPDVLIWSGNNSSIYTVQNGYRSLLQSESSHSVSDRSTLRDVEWSDQILEQPREEEISRETSNNDQESNLRQALYHNQSKFDAIPLVSKEIVGVKALDLIGVQEKKIKVEEIGSVVVCRCSIIKIHMQMQQVEVLVNAADDFTDLYIYISIHASKSRLRNSSQIWICVLLVDKPKQIASDILRVGVALSIGRV
ncbi:hypothetical protein K1719_040205 [Acacia pycnantha]|nr:hypothetical protein K1719_040205 [Acacia pycnantha]